MNRPVSLESPRALLDVHPCFPREWSSLIAQAVRAASPRSRTARSRTHQQPTIPRWCPEICRAPASDVCHCLCDQVRSSYLRRPCERRVPPGIPRESWGNVAANRERNLHSSLRIQPSVSSSRALAPFRRSLTRRGGAFSETPAPCRARDLHWEAPAKSFPPLCPAPPRASPETLPANFEGPLPRMGVPVKPYTSHPGTSN